MGQRLESYIAGPLKNYFLSQDYIYGVCERKNELSAKQSKLTSHLFLFTILLAFFDSLVGSHVAILGISLDVKPIFASIICVFSASAFVATTFIFIDCLIIDNYLATIGRSVNMYSFGLYTLPKTAINLWAEANTVKYFGLISGRGHQAAQIPLNLIMFLAILTIVLFPTLVCGEFIVRTWTNRSSNNAELILTGIAGLMILTSWLIGILFAVRFKFKPADFHEADGTPTPEFIARVEAETAAKQ